ncbi:MAG: hypothetical protein ACREQV_05580 [Candidatus Binatia bacterium]
MKDLVDESVSILNGGRDITAFGALLHEAWQAKRGMSAKVSNTEVDEIYELALAKGALGGKLLGAGGGGFMLLFVRPDQQAKLRESLKNFTYVPFRFEFAGSQIIFFDPQEEYFTEEMARASQDWNSNNESSDPLQVGKSKRLRAPEFER